MELAVAWLTQSSHLDEAEFAFEQREFCLESPLHDFEGLVESGEERLWANVDGLVVGGGPVQRELVAPTVDDAGGWQVGRIAAAGLARIACPDDDGLGHVLEAYEASEPGDPRWTALLGALSLSDHPQLDERLFTALTLEPNAYLRHRLPLLARRPLHAGARRPPALGSWLRASDPQIVMDALDVASKLGSPEDVEAVVARMGWPHEEVSAHAILAGLPHWLPHSWRGAWTLAFGEASSPALRDRARLWVALLGDYTAHRRLLRTLDVEGASPGMVLALGYTGRFAAVDACLALLEDEDLAPLVGELMCAIAGMPRDRAELWQPQKQGGEDEALPPLELDDLDADLSIQSADLLPRPEPEAARAWWVEHRRHLDPEVRYLDGRPYTLANLHRVLNEGPLRRRHAHAFDLSVRTRAAIRLESRARATVQRATLARLNSVELDFRRGFAGS